MTLAELAKQIEATVVGDGALEVASVATLEEAGAGQLSFLSNPKYVKQLETTNATAVVASPEVSSERLTILRTKNPYQAFMQAVVLLHGFRKHPFEGIHPAAHVDPTASVGEGTTIYPGVFVGPRVKIGRDCILYPNVVVYDDCVLGDRVTLHANTTIGQDGFGYATVKGVHHKIPQAGNAVIEDDCELGANCSVDRATLGSTVVGKGTKFSNGVVIGHGSKIGAHGLFVAQVGLAGSVTVGHHATMGGQVGVAGHLKIGDNVTIGAQAGVASDIPDESTMLGAPAMPISQARRVVVYYTQLPAIVDRIKKLEQQVEELGAGEGGDEAGGE